MPEIRVPAMAVEIDYICDECGVGLMQREGNVVITTYPPKYPHVCDVCGCTGNFTSVYPYIDWSHDETN